MKKIINILIKNLCYIAFSLIIFAYYKPLYAKPQLHILDGDSFEFGDKSIRLLYIDAPELKQTCHDKNGKIYNCGIEAQKFLTQLSNTPNFYCTNKGNDIYGRELSVCYANGKNVNEEIIKAGWAIAYRADSSYILKLQEEAKAKKLGIHQGKFISPELYRQLNKRKK